MAIAMRYGTPGEGSGSGGGSSGGVRVDLLWTNPNPTSNFSAQTVSIDLSGYDAVRITFIANMGSPVCYTQEADIDSYDHLLSVVSAAPARQSRSFTLSSTGIVFANGATGNTSGSQYGVPIKIWGIKF